MVVLASIAVATIGWATFGDGPWLVAALAVLGALGFGHGLLRGAREWDVGMSGGPVSSGIQGGTWVVVERPAKGYTDRLRGYRVMVDGRAVGHLLPGRSVQAPVEPGEHVVQLRIDWARSRGLTVQVERDETARLIGEPRPAWAALFWSTLGSRRYVRLRPAES
jgi:hypothetical protein